MPEILQTLFSGHGVYRTCTASLLCGALSRWAGPTVMGFFCLRGSLVTRWEAPGGFWASSLLWLANFSFSTLMLLVGSLTCKTVSRITYTVLVETLNPAQSNPINIHLSTVSLFMAARHLCCGTDHIGVCFTYNVYRPEDGFPSVVLGVGVVVIRFAIC